MNDVPPPRVQPRIKAAPKIRQLYWCDLPEDAHLPEFWKRRPVLVVSYRTTLHGAVTVLPCSTQAQPENKWALRLPVSIDGAESWVICDKPMTVAVSRLSVAREGIPRLSEDDFHAVLAVLLQWLPVLPPPDAEPAA